MTADKLAVSLTYAPPCRWNSVEVCSPNSRGDDYLRGSELLNVSSHLPPSLAPTSVIDKALHAGFAGVLITFQHIDSVVRGFGYDLL